MDDMSLAVSFDRSHNVPVAIFKLAGEIDVASYERLQDKADEVIAAGTTYILLDLTDVTYISSSGLRALHHIFTQLRAEESDESDAAMRRGLRDGSFKSSHLKLLKPQRAVLDVLKTAGFDLYLEVYKNREKALAAFG
jgi:anti-anti-sigma factor